MRSYKLILPESMAGHITYSKEKLRACSGLSKYFNVKWGKDVFAESESTRPLKKSFSTLASLASGELTQVWLIATSDKRKCY